MQSNTTFPFGVRRGWSDWQKKDASSFYKWLKSAGFDVVDLMNVTRDDLAAVKAAGLQIGSVDLVDFPKICATDEAERKETIAKNIAYVKDLAGAGAKVFFTCVMPGDPTKPRAENYKIAVDCFSPIAQAAHDVGAKIAVEGWPGGAPHYANLCCTPETMRTFIRDVAGDAVGVNYDPSHLIRLGVDHVRFLREFLPRVYHVHAKDTELYDESLYELGRYQPSAFSKSRSFGEWVWRYTIPGHGIARWPQIFRVLKDANYSGAISVELEDKNFNGTEPGEKAGLTNSLAFLKSI